MITQTSINKIEKKSILVLKCCPEACLYLVLLLMRWRFRSYPHGQTMTTHKSKRALLMKASVYILRINMAATNNLSVISSLAWQNSGH